MWHNRFSENENKAVGAPIHDTAIPRHRDSKAKKPRHRETETINPRHRDSKTFFQRTKSHDIEIPRPKNHGIEIPRPKSQDIGFPRNSDPSCPRYRRLVHIPAFNISSFLCRFIPRSFTPQCLRAPLIFRNDNSLIMRRECLATEIVETKHLAGITEE